MCPESSNEANYKEELGEIINAPFNRKEFPGSLYHYTTLEGLRGILSNCCLWATYAGDLEDRSELGVDQSLVPRIAAAWTGSADGMALLTTYLRDYQGRTIKDRFSIFIASLTEVGDSPHNWEAFGHRSTGCAVRIRFPPDEELPAGIAATQFEVWYDREALSGLLAVAVDAVVSCYVRHADRLPNDRRVLLGRNALLRLSAFTAISLKRPQYQPEHEWRIAAYTADKSLLQSRLRDGRRIRYIELPLRGSGKVPLAEEIVIGGAAPLSREDEIAELLDVLGYGRHVPRPLVRRAGRADASSGA